MDAAVFFKKYSFFSIINISFSFWLHLKPDENFENSYFILTMIIPFVIIYFWKLISIIHPRCIREVFSDILSSSPISGYFCIISALTVTTAWLWKSQAASVIATCYARASTKAKKNLIRPDFSCSYRHLSFSKQPMKTGHSTLLCYI